MIIKKLEDRFQKIEQNGTTVDSQLAERIKKIREVYEMSNKIVNLPLVAFNYRRTMETFENTLIAMQRAQYENPLLKPFYDSIALGIDAFVLASKTKILTSPFYRP